MNKVLITEIIKKIEKDIRDFFKSLKQFFLKFNFQVSIDFFKTLRQFSLKFNDPEAISKQLTVLIKC